MSKPVITIARGFGSGGRTIGKMLAQRLSLDYYDMELLRLASEESGINLELFGRADETVKLGFFKKYNKSYWDQPVSPSSMEFTSDDNLFQYQAKVIRDLADKQNCVIIGRCADHILKYRQDVLRIFFYADEESCIKTVTKLYGVPEKTAADRIHSIDRARAAYYKYYTGKQWNDVCNYDLCINTTKIGFDKAVDVVVAYMKENGMID